ncbi:MAG: sigma 54-interacting transcriptional regulator [Bacteroidota bacterium]
MDYPIIGRSKTSQLLIKTIHRIAATRRDLLIIGESGVGKGTLAKSIYQVSRSDSESVPFLSLNLSAIDEKEVEYMLFGNQSRHVPSAKRRSAVQKEHGGFVLIEDIEEGNLLSQMKVLKFIEESRSKKSGSEKNISTGIRFIVTMKENPVELVRKRNLLEELQKIFMKFETVYIPPLCERREDIPLLVKHFKDTLCKDLNLPDVDIDAYSIEVLVHQPWYGNIRELKAVTDQCILYLKDGGFTLPPEMVDEKTEIIKMLDNVKSGQKFTLRHSLGIIERGIIERVLKRFGFNQRRASTFLGMNQQSLRYRLKRLSIP